MTARSSAPPPPSPLLDTLARAAAFSRFLAAMLLAAASVRFAVAAFEHTLGAKPRTDTPTPSATSERPLVRQTTPPVPAGSVAKAAPGRPRSLQLGISAGSGRMEVYVNGRLLGQTPFVGDTSCKTGMPLKIELVPQSGPPLVYERECRGSMIEITGPPP
jgi:hypothetical protein